MTAETTPDRREARRLKHQDLSRNQLLDAAEELFGRKGFYETTLQEIADLAGFSVGSVYSFFDSKDDLFLQIFQRRGGDYMPRISGVLRGPGTPLDLLHDLVNFEINYFREHFHFGRLWLRHSGSTLQSVERLADELILGNYRESMRLQAELFERGQRDASFGPGEPAALARLFSGLVSAFQSLDPKVMSDDPGAVAPLSDDEFHALVERAFVT